MRVVYRISAFTLLLMSIYAVFVAVLHSGQSSSPDNPVVGVLAKVHPVFEPNITAMFSASPVRALRVFVISSDGTRLPRLVGMLENAVYPGGLRVDLVIVGARRRNTSDLRWSHGALSSSSGLVPVTDESLAVVLGDAMEISPFYALWFLLQWNTPLVSGGGDRLRPAGLAVSSRLWNSASARPLPELLDALVAVCHCSAVFPMLGDGRVFVRHEYQLPVLAERYPILVRAWNLSRSQWNI